jgi:hypothetical protein
MSRDCDRTGRQRLELVRQEPELWRRSAPEIGEVEAEPLARIVDGRRTLAAPDPAGQPHPLRIDT